MSKARKKLKRRKLASAGISISGRTEPFDMRATELPPHAVVRPIIVPDPYEHGATIVAFQSIRDDPLGRLHARGQIEYHQYTAGREMQGHYERASVGGGVKAMDPTKEPVDGGGGFPEPVTDAMKAAIDTIHRINKVLGREGAALVRAVLAERLFVNQIVRNGPERENRYIARRLRECLETIAEELGHKSRGSRFGPTRA